MGRSTLLSLVFFLSCILSSFAADSVDPSDLFLNAYLAVQAGEKYEGDGNYKLALGKYRYAEGLLDRLTKEFAEWQPLIVDYRKKKTDESIAKLQQKVGLEGPGAVSPSSALPESNEPPLPERDNPSAEVSVPTSSNPNDVVDDATRKIRDRIKHLEQDLESEHERADTLERQKQDAVSKYENALRDRDARKVEAVEQKSRVRELEEALKNALAEGSQSFNGKTKLDQEIARLQKDLVQARDERDDARQESQDVVSRYDNVKKKTDSLKQSRDEAGQRNKEMADKLAAAEKQVAELSKQQDTTSKSNADLTAKLADATKQVASLRKDRDEAQRVTSDLTAKFEGAEKELAAVKSDRDVLRQQRDSAVADLNKLKQAQTQVAKLMEDNTSLTQKLADAEKEITQFKQDGPRKDEQIASLTKEVTDAKNELASTQKQNKQFQLSIGELQNQLDNTSSELERMKAGGATPEEKKRLTDENTMLRQIVYRSLKEEARREQSRTIVVSELSKLEGQSSVLMERIKYLSEPVVKLSPQESALFRQPDVALSETPDQVNIEIAAPKPGATQETSINPPLPVANATPEAARPPLVSGTAGSLAAASPPALPGSSPQASGASESPHVDTAPPAPNVPAEVLPLVRDAKDSYERGKFRESERAYERALLKAPNNVFILSNLGVVRFKLNKYKGSEEAFKKAIAIDSNDTFSRTTLGIVYYQQGKYDDAVDQLTKALAINPKLPQAHNYLGITASMKGWHEATEKELLTAIALDPNYADANFNLAVVYATGQPPDKEKAKK